MLDEIESLGVDDVPGCLALARDRGWTQRERMWRLLLEEGRGFGVRDEDGDLAGTVVLTEHGEDLAAIGMMLVATRYAGRGIGRRLMEHALAEVGDATVFLYATDHGRPLYEKLGFAPIGTSHSHRGVFVPRTHDGASGLAHEGEPTAADAGPEVVRVRPATAADLDAIAELDARTFGGDREALLRRLPDFAEHLLVAVERADAGTDGAIVGFAGSWDGSNVTAIGPVIARTPELATRLIGELATRAAGTVMVDLDESRDDMRTWAAEHGLSGRATTTVMVRGADSLPGDRSAWFAPLAKAIG